MPHFVLEYSKEVEQSADMAVVMKTVQDVAADCDFMNLDDVKIRAKAYEHYLMPQAGQSFLHVTVYLLTGRSDALKEQLAIDLRSRLVTHLAAVTSVSIDVRDMNPTAYKKRVLS